MSVLLLWLASVPLLTVCACLDVASPVGRLLVAFAAALAVGAFPAHSVGGALRDYALWSVMTFLGATISAASLLVFRWLGYRLIHAPRAASGGAETPEGA